MRSRLIRPLGSLLAAGLAISLIAPTAAAAATPAPATTSTAVSTATCSDGHWPASVQGVPSSWHSGARAGDYIWHDSKGWHVRVTHPGTARVVFTGRIVSSAPLDAMPVKLEGRDTVSLSADHRVITYRLLNYGHVDGFNFVTSCARSLTFYGAMGGAKLGTGRIYIGHYGRHPLENPFVIRRVA